MRDFITKVDNTAPADSGILKADEDNVRFEEMEKIVTSSGITLDPYNGPDVDKTMLAQTTARYASGGVWYQDSGAANAYVLTTPLAFIMPKAYFDGMMVTFVPGVDNSGSSTASANGIGAKPVFNFDESALSGGELLASRHTSLIYSSAADSASGGWLIAPWAIPPVSGGGGEANTASNVGAGVGIFKTKSGVDLRLKSITGINGIVVSASGTDDIEIDGSGGIGSSLRIYPEILNASATLAITDNGGGQVEIDVGQTFLHRGVTTYDTTSFSAPQRQFSTVASKEYHMRFDFTGGTFSLVDVTALSEADQSYDSDYDDMLFAKIVTDGSNVPSITALLNRDRLIDSSGGSGTPTSSSGSNGANRTFTETYNWARTPKAIASASTVTTNGPITDIDLVLSTTVDRYKTDIFMRWDFATTLGYEFLYFVV